MAVSKALAPRLLSSDEAAFYCGIDRDQFNVVCSVAKVRIAPGRGGLRYDKKRLDEWIDSLPDESGDRKHTQEYWLSRVGNKKPRR